MKKFVFVIVFLLFSLRVNAQSPIVIGPNSTLNWDLIGLLPTTAQTCTYAISIGSGTFNNLISPITCVALGTSDSTCSSNLVATGLPLNSNSIRMTVTCNSITNLPSTPFAYVILAIPIPSNLRIK